MNVRLDIDKKRPLRMLIGWPKSEPPYPTPLVERCEAALELPLEHQSIETLRLLLNQEIGVTHLLPRALEILELNILACGDMYEGDLLAACQRLPASYWNDHPEHWMKLDAILDNFDRSVRQVNKHRAEFQAKNPFGAQL